MCLTPSLWAKALILCVVQRAVYWNSRSSSAVCSESSRLRLICLKSGRSLLAWEWLLELCPCAIFYAAVFGDRCSKLPYSFISCIYFMIFDVVGFIAAISLIGSSWWSRIVWEGVIGCSFSSSSIGLIPLTWVLVPSGKSLEGAWGYWVWQLPARIWSIEGSLEFDDCFCFLSAWDCTLQCVWKF